MYIYGLPLINPAYPLDIKNEEEWVPTYLSDHTICPPLGEDETIESLLKKYFYSPADEK